MKTIYQAKLFYTVLIGVLFVIGFPRQIQAMTLQFQWDDTFTIYAHEPDPHIHGFDYWFSPERVISSVAGQLVRVDEIRIVTPATSLGVKALWDLEVHLNGAEINLPEGQFIKTHIDPVADYDSNAETQFNYTMYVLTIEDSYLFDVTHNFLSGQTTIYPPDRGHRNATFNPEMIVDDGLHAQLFFWTGENRNCHLSFDGVSMEVDVTIIPEPGTLLLLMIGTIGILLRKFRTNIVM